METTRQVDRSTRISIPRGVAVERQKARDLIDPYGRIAEIRVKTRDFRSMLDVNRHFVA